MNQTHVTPEELIDYLHGAVSAERDAAIYAHLASCSECAEARDLEVALTEMLREHAAAQERDMPPSVATNVWEAVARKPSVWDRLGAAFRPAVAVPVAIAIAAFLYFGVRVAHRPAQAATIDAAYYVDNHAMLDTATPFSQDDTMPQELASDVETR